MEVRQALLTLLNLRRDQRAREAAFLAQYRADAWRWSQLPRDADGFLCIEDMDPCDEAWFYDVTAGRA